MTSPRWIDVQAPAVELKALTWGPPDGPIALCLHGFPDTAYGWRNFAPRLAESGWRVVAPFMRGYAPSSIPSDGSDHHVAVGAAGRRTHLQGVMHQRADVIAAVRRDRRGRIAAHERRHHPPAGLGQSRREIAPAISGVGKSIQAQRDWPIGRPPRQRLQLHVRSLNIDPAGFGHQLILSVGD